VFVGGSLKTLGHCALLGMVTLTVLVGLGPGVSRKFLKWPPGAGGGNF